MTGCTKPTCSRRGRQRLFWLIIWALTVAGKTHAQELPAPAAVPDSVRNQLTARYVRVPGSTFYVRPAVGYAPEESLNGLARPGDALLEVMRVPEANFLKVRSLLVQQYFAERGARVHTQQQFTFNGYPAVFGEGASLEPGQNLMVLAFGDTAAIELVFGLYPSADAAAGTELRQMLLGGWYDARGQVPPLEVAPFVVNLSGTPFRLLQVQPAERRYVFGTAAAATDSLAPRFTVQVLPPTPAATARQMLQALVQGATTRGATLQSQERELASPVGWSYEVRGSSTRGNRRYAFYQALKTDDEATLLFHGVNYLPVLAATPKTGPKSKNKTSVAKAAPPADPAAVFERVAASLRMKR